MNREKKILLVSYNALSKEGANGRTLEFLLSGFKKENIAQLFFSQENPDFSFASTYYKITEESILKAIVKRKCAGGVVKEYTDEHLPVSENLATTEKTKSFFSSVFSYAKAYKRTTVMKFLRGLLWSVGKKYWNTKQFKGWLEAFDPDVIVTISGKNSCFHRIAVNLSKEKDIPLIVYHCEDYCFKQEKNSPFYKMYIRDLKKSVDEIMNCASLAIYNSESTKQLYSKEYDVLSRVVYMSSDVKPAQYREFNKDNLVLSYMGNLELKRYESVCRVAEALRKVSPNAVINVYSPKLPENCTEMFSKYENIFYKGYISYEECKGVIEESDILLHVESFEENVIKNLKVAFSTKIADSLASGRVFLVYAPRGIASTEYLIENECAFVVNEEEKIEEALLKLIDDACLRNNIIQKALELALKNHTKEETEKQIKKAITEVCG